MVCTCNGIFFSLKKTGVHLTLSKPVEDFYENLTQTKVTLEARSQQIEINALECLLCKVGESKLGSQLQDSSDSVLCSGWSRFRRREGSERGHFKGLLTWLQRNKGQGWLKAGKVTGPGPDSPP